MAERTPRTSEDALFTLPPHLNSVGLTSEQRIRLGNLFYAITDSQGQNPAGEIIDGHIKACLAERIPLGTLTETINLGVKLRDGFKTSSEREA